jgi:hypothetical protein
MAHRGINYYTPVGQLIRIGGFIRSEDSQGRGMKRSLRAVRIFLVWVVVFFLQGMLYTAHRGFDFPEIMVLAPIFAAITTVFWLRKFPK